MKKTHLTAAVKKAAGLTNQDAKNAVTAVFGIIAEEMRHGREVQIHGFMTFGTKARRGRNGRNPATGAALWIAGYRVADVKVSKLLKRLLREEEDIYE